jgi:hypothetical protein
VATVTEFIGLVSGIFILLRGQLNFEKKKIDGFPDQ